MKHILAPIVLSLVLTACGGGGGGSPTSSTSVASQPVMAATLYDTSYKNFKSYTTSAITYPSYHGAWGGSPIAIGYGEFLKKGELSVFIAYQNYNPSTDSLATVQSDARYLSEFTFWSVNSDKTLTKVSGTVGCLHPRKAVVADFNKDNIPDIFVACHGYDASPFPGEKSKLLLSNGQGSYTTTDVGDNEFTHSASAADVNNDGYPDIVVATGSDIFFYINQQNGTFVKNTSLVTNPNLPYFTVELIDTNSDGKVDLLIGGHEFQGATTKILYGDNIGFGNTSTIIPAIAGGGVVVDFTYIPSKNQLFVDRTHDSTSTIGMYGGLVLQVVNVVTGVSSVLADIAGSWVYWITPSTSNGQTGVVPFTGTNTLYYY